MSKKTFIFLVSGMIIISGFFVAQAAGPVFDSSPKVASSTLGIIFNGSPVTHSITWAAYDGLSSEASHASLAESASNSNACTGGITNTCLMPSSGQWDASGLTVNGYAKSKTGYLDRNMLDSTVWTLGTGSIGGFGQNGTTAENERIWSVDPFGRPSMIWRSVNDAASDADGGWGYSNIPVSPNKAYRSSVWVRKDNTSTGTVYFGLDSGNTLTLANASNGNPYFFSFASNNLISGRWYLLVGYIHANNDSSATSYSGVYDGVTGQKIISGTDFKNSNGTTQTHRTYNYYDTTTGSIQYFWGPRFEEIDGNEPTIESLLGVYQGATNAANAYFGGNVGIGTAGPTIKFAVGDTDTGLNSAGDGLLDIYSNNVNTMSIRSGNVGIGTTGPGNLLEVGSGAAATYAITEINGGTNTGQGAGLMLSKGGTSTGGLFSKSFITGAGTSNDIFMFAETGNALHFATNGSATERLTIAATGNVGIGTASPGYKLDVSGDMRVNDIYNLGWFRNYDRAGIYNQTYNTHFYTHDASFWRMSSNAGMQFTSANTYDSAVVGYVYHDGNGFGLLAGDGNWRLRTFIGGQELYGTTNFTGGNVGIGTTNPAHQLSVGSATSDGQAVTVRGYSNSPASWKGGGAFGYTSASVIMGELSGVAQIGGHNGTLGAWANLAINSGGGNVGIGTTGPAEKLDVSGNIALSGKRAFMGYDTWLRINESSVFTSGIYAGSGILRTDGALEVGPGGATMRAVSGGNVGIGNASPDAQMSGTHGIGIYSSTYPAIGFSNPTTNWLWYGEGALFKMWNSSAGDMLTGKSNGFIGIGTTNPAAKLDVNGTIYASATGGFANSTYAGGARNPIWRFGNADGYGFSYFQGSAGIGGLDTIGFHFGTATAAASLLQLNQNGTVTMQGNVGIGTTNPVFPLHISKAYSSTVGAARIDNGVVTAFQSNYDTALIVQPDVPSLRLIETNTGALATQQELSFAVGDDDAVIRSSATVPNGLSLMVNAAPGSVGYNEGVGTLGIKILNSGNVGIGTTAPGYKLDVQGGQINTSGGLCIAGVCQTSWSGITAGGVAWGNITSKPGWLSSASLIETLSNANSWANSGFYENGGGGSNWPSATWYNAINVRHSNQGNYHGFQVAMSYYDNNLWFRSYQGSGSFQQWVRAISNAGGAIDGGLTIAGNVGIGTTAPGYKLDIVAGAAGSKLFKASYPGGVPLFGYSDSGGSGISNTDPYTSGALVYFAGTKTHFYSGSTLAMTVSAGNVGIGTQDPTQKLQVAGYVRGDTGMCIGASCITSWPTGNGGNADTVDTYHMNQNVLSSSNPTFSGVYVGTGSYQWVNNQYTWTNTPRLTSPNSITLYDQYSSNGGSGNPTSYGTLLDIYGRTSHLDSQLYFGEGGQLLYRYAFYNQNSWNGWQTIITSANIGSQAVSYATFAGSATSATSAGTATFASSADYATTAGSAPNGTNLNNYYDVNAVEGYGLRFWNGNDSYKISMGSSAVYKYGPVTDYSIKMQMDSGSTLRGFTWGRIGVAPIAALNSYNGNMQIAGSMTAPSFIYSSDRNLKKNIATIENPLEKILKLRGVTFNWKENNIPSVGLIAQEVELVFPELVTGKDGGKGVQYGNLVAPLIEAVKVQQSEINALEARIKILENRK